MLTIERSGFGHIETAGLRVVGIVKPETNMERVGRWQEHGGIKTKDLIQENCLDSYISD